MRYLSLSSVTLFFLHVIGLTAAEASKTIEFNRDIRPLLSDNCYLCHGPARAARKADLRFDTQDRAFADLGGYKAIVPGDFKESHLWQRLNVVDAILS